MLIAKSICAKSVFSEKFNTVKQRTSEECRQRKRCKKLAEKVLQVQVEMIQRDP